MPEHQWKCAACGERNPPYTEVCRSCYAPPAAEAAITLRGDEGKKAADQDALMTCPVCEQAINSGQKKMNCPTCGTLLRNVEGQWQALRKRGRLYRFQLFFFACFVIALLAALPEKNPAFSIAAVLSGGLFFLVIVIEGVIEGSTNRYQAYGVVTRKRNPISYAVYMVLNCVLSLLMFWLSFRLYANQ